MGKWGDVKCLSVNSFSTHTSGARGLKFSRNNYHIGGSKFTNHIFDILSRSWDIYVQSYVVNKASPPIPVELEGWNLVGIIIILVAQNLPTRLSSKLCSEFSLTPPPYFFRVEFYCRKQLFVVCCAIESINWTCFQSVGGVRYFSLHKKYPSNWFYWMQAAILEMLLSLKVRQLHSPFIISLRYKVLVCEAFLKLMACFIIFRSVCITNLCI